MAVLIQEEDIITLCRSNLQDANASAAQTSLLKVECGIIENKRPVRINMTRPWAERMIHS